MKVVNIDEFLREKQFKIVLKGKEYVVGDIPVEVSEILTNPPVDYKKACSLILGCDEKELDGVGIGALTKIVNSCYENLAQNDSAKSQ